MTDLRYDVTARGIDGDQRTRISERLLLRRFLKDPFSGLSHALGALLAIAGLIFLICESHRDPWRITSFAVYGATLVVLYTASALYHSLHVGPRATGALYGLDRAAIYALIAGTYTPVCLLVLPAAWGWSVFGAVWLLAAVGIAIDIISRRKMPNWLQALIYLVMGWVAVVAIVPLVHSLPALALGWLAAGSLIYTVGAVVCVTEQPKLKPGIFGAHDLWHVFVLAGSACHFVLMVIIARGA